MKSHVSLLLACLLPTLVLIAAAQPGNQTANFDARHQLGVSAQVLSGERLNAALELKRRIPGIQIDLDSVTEAPSWIRNAHGFLTPPDSDEELLQPQPKGIAQRFTEPPDSNRRIRQFLDDNAALFGHGSDILDNARVSRQFTTAHNGMRTIVWEQHLDGIPVFEAVLSAHIARSGELICLSSQFLPNPAEAADAGVPNRAFVQAFAPVSPQQAVASAATNIGEQLIAEQVESVDFSPEGPSQKQRFDAPALLGEVRCDLVWLPIGRQVMRLCWRVILKGRTRREMFQVLVDTQTGHVQARHSWTFYAQPATFRVFGSDSPSPFTPGWSTPNTNQPPLVPQTNITLTALSTNASPNGWVNTNSALFLFVNTTIGNNVDAHTDRRTNDYAYDVPLDPATDPPRPIGTLNGSGILQFLFTANLTNQPPTTNYPARNQDAAVVNAFYWCNWYHDRFYDLGFTEAAGNYQKDNFGRGGVGNDAVQVDV